MLLIIGHRACGLNLTVCRLSNGSLHHSRGQFPDGSERRNGGSRSDIDFAHCFDQETMKTNINYRAFFAGSSSEPSQKL
jgi:hypothetical protein